MESCIWSRWIYILNNIVMFEICEDNDDVRSEYHVSDIELTSTKRESYKLVLNKISVDGDNLSSKLWFNLQSMDQSLHMIYTITFRLHIHRDLFNHSSYAFLIALPFLVARILLYQQLVYLRCSCHSNSIITVLESDWVIIELVCTWAP